jgi:hypothetical protein
MSRSERRVVTQRGQKLQNRIRVDVTPFDSDLAYAVTNDAAYEPTDRAEVGFGRLEIDDRE